MIIFLALLIAAVFCGSSLISLFGRAPTGQARSAVIAVAAGILLALAFGDLFPESLELADRFAIAGFTGTYAALFVIESLTRAHTHHTPGEHVHRHAHTPFLLGLAFHNLADGFALGVSAKLAGGAGLAVGLGVLIHQIPVGLSLAAVLAADHTPRRAILWMTAGLGLVIPGATLLTVILPPLSDTILGILISSAGGVLTYMSTAHLLPEAQAEQPSHTTSVVFAATLIVMTMGIFTIFSE